MERQVFIRARVECFTSKSSKTTTQIGKNFNLSTPLSEVLDWAKKEAFDFGQWMGESTEARSVATLTKNITICAYMLEGKHETDETK